MKNCEEIREGQAPAQPRGRKLAIQEGSAGASPPTTPISGIFHTFNAREGQKDAFRMQSFSLASLRVGVQITHPCHILTRKVA